MAPDIYCPGPVFLYTKADFLLTFDNISMIIYLVEIYDSAVYCRNGLQERKKMDDTPKQGFTEKLRKLIKNTDASDDEVLAVVDEFKKQGYLEDEEAEMISNVVEMSDTNASDVMTHRTRLDAIASEESIESALRLMLEGNHTRYPLYEETIDNIIGMLYIKDLMSAYMDGKGSENVAAYAREALYVPETMPVDSLFETLREKRTHIAVVVDEYGQTAGVVTLEDIIEEIVGDILDEYDEEEENIDALSDGQIGIQPDTRLDELEEMTGIKIEEKDMESFDTINGLLISIMGHIPEQGEKSEVEYNGWIFKIFSEEGRMISEIKATAKNDDTGSEETGDE